MDVPPTRRIVFLGKTGAGKSSLANTIFGETVFKMSHFPVSETSICQAESKLVKGRNITLIDTPGLFDTGRSEEDMKPEILKCIVECAPGPHAFVIVLKVEKYTDHEKDVISKICQYFSEEALQYATILFTHGNQLPEEMTIQEFVSKSEGLIDLVKKCGGRCHVIDNKYWNSESQNEYRSNQFQVEQLFNTIEAIVTNNKGGYYTNELLQAVEREIEKEEEHIRQEGNVCQKETREKAKNAVFQKNIARFARITGKGLMIGALLGGAVLIGPEVAALLGVVNCVKAIRQAVTKERPAIKKTSKEDTATRGAERKGPVPAQAASTPGPTKSKTAADVLKTIAKLFGTKDAQAQETVEGGVCAAETDEPVTMVTQPQGETQGPAVGAPAEEDAAMESAGTEIAAADEVAVALNEGTEQLAVEISQEATVSAAGETFDVAVEEAAGGIAVAAEGETVGVVIGAMSTAEGGAGVEVVNDNAVDGVAAAAAEGTAAVEAVAERAVEVAAVVDGAAASAVQSTTEGTVAAVVEMVDGVAEGGDVVAAVVAAATEICCIQ